MSNVFVPLRPVSLIGPTAVTLTALGLVVAMFFGAWLVGAYRSRFAFLFRAVGLFVSVGSGLVAVAIFINATMGFYPTSEDLIGSFARVQVDKVEQLSARNPPQPEAGSKQQDWKNADLPARIRPKNEAVWKPSFVPSDEFGGDGQVYDTTFTGPISGIELPVRVWVPRGFDPQNTSQVYNVLEFLHGNPGSHLEPMRHLDLARRLQAAIDEKRIPPTIFVLPNLNVDPTSPDCVDLKGRPAVQTWVSTEVPTMIRSVFPNVSGKRSGWSIMGVSAGAYCAISNGIIRADVYGAAISLSGYDLPIVGRLRFASDSVRHDNTLSRMIAKPRKFPSRLLFGSNALDSDAQRLTQNVALLPKGDADEFAHLEISGGHNWGAWNLALPQVLTWLGNGSVAIGGVTPLAKGELVDSDGTQRVSLGSRLFGVKSLVLAVCCAVLALLGMLVVLRWGGVFHDSACEAVGRNSARQKGTRCDFSTVLASLRVRRLAWFVMRLTMVGVITGLIVCALFILVNREMGFYASWTDLWREFTVVLLA